MAGNILLGGLIGAGVDAGTGAIHSHKPNPLVVDLLPLSGGLGTSSISMQGPVSTAASVDSSSVGMRSLIDSEREACQELQEFSIAAGGKADASANLALAMDKALRKTQESGADAYYLLNTNATASSASVTLETYQCSNRLVPRVESHPGHRAAVLQAVQFHPITLT